MKNNKIIAEFMGGIKSYKNPQNERDFYKARKHLNKVHKQYGTIDISTIQNLIK